MIVLRPRGPFALEESIAFLGGFAPAGAPQPDPDTLVLALSDDGGSAVGLAVTAHDDVLHVEWSSSLPEDAVAAHAARVLSVDVDATDWPAVGGRDPVVGELQRLRPGLRPVTFGSPFEAAVWTILTQRVRMDQAARQRDALAQALGEPVTVAGVTRHAFPAPARLAGVDAIPGVWPVKVERIRAVAAVAAEGGLTPGHLRAMEVDEARAYLTGLPGIGPFGADLILARGAGHPDVPVGTERRALAIAARRYGLAEAELERRLPEVSEAWRPFRSWVWFLFRSSG